MKTFELILSREGEKIRVCASDKPKQTLKHYEDKGVSFKKIDELCDEILLILNRANKRGDVADRLIEDLKKAGQDLFDELLTPTAKKSLLSTSSKTLSLDIDDQLIHIPWELLYDGDQFLCRKFSIGRTVSTKQNISGSQHRIINTSLKMLIIADPQENLKAAYKEGIRIRDELIGWEDKIKVNRVSSRVDTRYVRRNIRDYDILHYTGHAEYNEKDPSRSGWLMSDGIWTASDIKSITGETPFPFLIFSNACHSGRTGLRHVDKEYEKEIYDLANTFLHCGVTHYIGTFLEVLDSPSSTFAVEFYKALGKEISVGEAVRIARERLVESYGESNIIWASYMLYGDPSYKMPYEIPQVDSGHKLKSKVSYAVVFILILIATYFGVKELKTPPVPLAEVHQVKTAVKPVQLKVSLKNIIGQREESGTASNEILSEGSKMYLYDKFHFLFKSNKNSYFYLITSDSHGKTNLLFHDLGDRTDNAEYLIPIEAHLLRLDENPTTEAIYILASESKLEEIEPILWEIEKLNESMLSEQPEKAQNMDNRSDYKIVTRIEISNGKLKAVR